MVSKDGQIVALGTNDPPKFGGGIYKEGDSIDARCSKFEMTLDGIKFMGCHNDRKKGELNEKIHEWATTELVPAIAESMYNSEKEKVKFENARSKMIKALPNAKHTFSAIPGVGDLIEFSRSIHAEMDALLSAGREGISTVASEVYVTTYPCHNCARHLVAAGVKRVFFVEPYSKSLALELHDDAISNKLPSESESDNATTTHKMAIVPFTGVGPAMYQQAFIKRDDLKGLGGAIKIPANGYPVGGVRLSKLSEVEDRAIELTDSTNEPAND